KKSNKQDTAHALNLKQHHHKESYTTIHHTTFNITYKLYAPLKRAERDSDADTAKRDVLPRENRKDASGSFSAHCIAMHESEW
ncbi:hypothetical protein ACND7K_005047, partial [Escherichia coli]